jgi:hypothetical protein
MGKYHRFRPATIHLGEDGEVASITVYVANDAPLRSPVSPDEPLELISRWTGTPHTGSYTKASGGMVAVDLPAGEAQALFHAAGKIRGTDPVYPFSREVYDSLAPVIYGLIED